MKFQALKPQRRFYPHHVFAIPSPSTIQLMSALIINLGPHMKFTPILWFTIASGLLVSCRTTTVSSVKETSGAVVAEEAALEATLTRWKASWHSLGISQSEWETTYSACHKNPAGKKLVPIQKVSYCYLPIEFRICNSLFLKKLEKSGLTDNDMKVDGFKQCAQSSKMAHLVGSPDDETLYREFFLNSGKNLSSSFISKITNTFTPVLSNEPFVVLLVRTVNRYIDSRGGLDTAEIELIETITPAVDDPAKIAGGARKILEIAGKAEKVAEEYLGLF